MLRVYDDMAMCASYAYAGNVDDFCLRSRFHLSMDFRLKIYIEIYILVYMYMIYIYIYRPITTSSDLTSKCSQSFFGTHGSRLNVSSNMYT